MRKNQSYTKLVSSPSNSSLAHKYGITMKQNSSLGSMGLNPNLNIEDEYIENLLKQIHFMNLEIKLTKQKQSQSEGNALWGIINRTNQPMVTNIVESSQKYQQMKKQNDVVLYKLEKDISRLENDRGALQTQLAFLEKKKAQINDKKTNWEQGCKIKVDALQQKIVNDTDRLKAIMDELERETKKQKQLTEEHNRMIGLDQIEKARIQKENLQIKNDEIIEQMMEKDLDIEILKVTQRKNDLVKLFEEDLDYIKASEDSKIIKQKMNNVQKQISQANFEILQLNQSLKMAELEREKEIVLRKKLTEQYEQKKTMLGEILILNALRKQKEATHRKNSSIDIMKAVEQTERLEKSLDEIKKKLLKNEQNNCTLTNEVENIERQINSLKQFNKSTGTKVSTIKSQSDHLDQEMLQLKNQIMILEDQYERSIKQETNTSLDLFELQRQLQYLRGRKELLTKNIQVNDVINQLSIQDLQKVVQKNNDLNSTVATLMSKWDQIKTFSRI